MTFLSDEAAAALAKRALAAWGLEGQEPELIARRENCVFRVRGPNGAPAALRLHRSGYTGSVEIASELALMEAVAAFGVTVPEPIPARDGERLVRVCDGPGDAILVDLLAWLPGAPLGRAGVPLGLGRAALAERFRELGAAAARLHLALDDWMPPEWFDRPTWNRDGLLGEAPVWGRFWENPALDRDQRGVIEQARATAREHLAEIASGADYGLIHADLVRENVLIGTGGAAIIDFGDAGWGWRAFELATILNRNREEPDFPLIEGSLIEGYDAIRPAPAEYFSARSLFFALRSFTYLGWIAERIGEPGAQARQTGMIARAEADAFGYLRSL